MSEGNQIAHVTIMAGIPGSGKSFTANMIREFNASLTTVETTEILSTDDFWLNEAGESRFDASRLTEAHGWNLRRFHGQIATCFASRSKGSTEVPSIIIDNTNTTIAEIAPYYAAAQAYGASVRVLAVLYPWALAAARQVHGVPAGKVYQMHLRLEDTLRNLPSWWKLEVKT